MEEILKIVLPEPAAIIKHLEGVVAQTQVIALFLRLLAAGLAGLCIWKRKIYPEYIAALVSLLLLGAGGLAVTNEENADLFTFFLILPLALLWGREALTGPRRPRVWWPGVIPALLFAGYALFYPHFVTNVTEWLLFAPLGLVPCPTLIFAMAAIMASGRAFSLWGVIPTWAVGAFFGAVGVFHLKIAADWPLLAAVGLSVVLYLAAPRGENRPKGRPRKRHR